MSEQKSDAVRFLEDTLVMFLNESGLSGYARTLIFEAFEPLISQHAKRLKGKTDDELRGCAQVWSNKVHFALLDFYSSTDEEGVKEELRLGWFWRMVENRCFANKRTQPRDY